MLGSFMLPIGLFWFAWAPNKDVHWIVPVLAGVPFGWGCLGIFVRSLPPSSLPLLHPYQNLTHRPQISATTYLVNVYQSENGASAVAANGILRYGLAPFAQVSLERTAKIYLKRVMNALDYIGVLAIEFFVVNGRLIANEMAPRVHNSGHWTIEGCVTSQFENHLRAICNLPLGSTRPLGHTAMINFLGAMPDRERLLGIEGLAFHDYGKAPRAGRKLGHCTVLRARAADRDRALKDALKLIKWS